MRSSPSVIVVLQRLFQIEQRLQARALVFGDPACADLMDGRRVEVVQLFASAFHGRDQVGVLQNAQVLRYSLACHAPAFAKLAQGLPVLREKRVEQGAAALVSQSAENAVNGLVFGVHAILYATKRLHVNACRPENWLSYAVLDRQNGIVTGENGPAGMGLTAQKTSTAGVAGDA